MPQGEGVGVEHVDDQRVVGRLALGGVHASDGARQVGAGAQPVDRLGRQGRREGPSASSCRHGGIVESHARPHSTATESGASIRAQEECQNLRQESPGRNERIALADGSYLLTINMRPRPGAANEEDVASTYAKNGPASGPYVYPGEQPLRDHPVAGLATRLTSRPPRRSRHRRPRTAAWPARSSRSCGAGVNVHRRRQRDRRSRGLRRRPRDPAPDGGRRCRGRRSARPAPSPCSIADIAARVRCSAACS